MTEKPVAWLGTSLETVRRFPVDVRRQVGYQLRRVQAGLMPSDWKALPTLGPGVYEIRLQVGSAYRVIYLAKFREAVYVLHVFEKRTRKTPAADLDLARKRLAALQVERRRGKG